LPFYSDNAQTLDIRQCKVEDIQSIAHKFKLSQTERFWTKEFLTDNANRSGFVLEKTASNEIYGFIFFELAEALNDNLFSTKNKNISDIKELKLRDLTISRSTEIAM